LDNRDKPTMRRVGFDGGF